MMLHDYKYSKPFHTVSPTPVLTALTAEQNNYCSGKQLAVQQ